jgi:hypothetical protein
MSKTTKTHARGISGWGCFILLLLTFLTGGLAFAYFAHTHPVNDGTNTSSPPIIGISIGNSYSSVGIQREYVNALRKT